MKEWMTALVGGCLLAGAAFRQEAPTAIFEGNPWTRVSHSGSSSSL